MNFIHDKRHKKEKGKGFLPERRSAGPVGVISFLHSYPLSLAALASSPKGTPFGAAGNFAATTEAVPLGKVAANAVSRRKGYSRGKWLCV